LKSLLSASFSASAKFASALLRVMSAILVLSVIRPERADCEVVSSDLHVFSLVVANVSQGPLCLLDAHLHEVAQRLRNLGLHECVISHDALLLPYLPCVVCLRLRRRPGALGPLAHGFLHGQ